MATGNWATINGVNVIRGELNIPQIGAWTLDADLDNTNTVLGASVTLIVGNLTLAGSVYRSAQYVGRTRLLAVGGANGWSKRLDANAYNNPEGVLASTILLDAANSVGEKVMLTQDATIGNFWNRRSGPASETLRLIAEYLSGGCWYIDNLGITRTGQRPSATIKSQFNSIDFWGGAGGFIKIATEDVASWLPNAQFTGTTLPNLTLNSVRHFWGEDGIYRLVGMLS